MKDLGGQDQRDGFDGAAHGTGRHENRITGKGKRDNEVLAYSVLISQRKQAAAAQEA